MAGLSIVDRITGKVVPPPSGTQALGRFMFLAGDRRVSWDGRPARRGQYLAADRSWRLTVEGAEHIGDHGGHPLPSPTVVDAVAALGGEVRAAVALTDLLAISPVVDHGQARQTLKQRDLEMAIEDHHPYLFAVCNRPAARLRPTHELLPVSRARTVTPRTVARLAAHSEDWSRLRLDGVDPAQVLTPQREVDLDLYENQATVHLTEQLWRYLNTRIAAVRELQVMLTEEIPRYVDDIRRRPWRTGDRLWRRLETFLLGDDWETQAAVRLDELLHLRSVLAALRGSPLWPRVSRRRELGTLLRPTNLFINDERYRRVSDLWRSWVRSRAEEASADDRQRRLQIWCPSFAAYVTLLVTLACDELGMRAGEGEPTPGPNGARMAWPAANLVITIRRAPADVIVVEAGDKLLVRVVPLPHALTASRHPSTVAAELDAITAEPAVPTLLLYPGSREDRAELPTSLRLRTHTGPGTPAPGHGSGTIWPTPVSPMDIDSVARVARALRWVIDAQRLTAYPRQVSCPTDLIRTIADQPWLATTDRGVQIRRPAASHELAVVRERLAAAWRGVTPSDDATRVADALARESSATAGHTRCPVCGKQPPLPERALQPRDDGTYRCECDNCGWAWETRVCRARPCATTFPVLLDPEPAVAHYDGDALDARFGIDLLACPCWVRSRVFICPTCAICPEARQGRGNGCSRCSPSSDPRTEPGSNG
jgi:hypothetical protein